MYLIALLIRDGITCLLKAKHVAKYFAELGPFIATCINRVQYASKIVLTARVTLLCKKSHWYQGWAPI